MIVCFGNSITEGTGAGAGEDYPSIINRLLQPAVVNAGVSGNTTADGLARVQDDVLSENPELVIVEFGANDYLRQMDYQIALRNLDRIVDEIQKREIAVILIEVPYGLFGGEFRRGLKRIAKARRTGFVPKTLRKILTDPSLKNDQIHPNREGYRVLADAVLKEIRRIYGGGIVKLGRFEEGSVT